MSGSVTDGRVEESSQRVSARLTRREARAAGRHRAVANGADSRTEGP